MNVEEALKIIDRYGPCPHFTLNEDLGDGRTWLKCEDCGREFNRVYLESSRKAALDFEEAIVTLMEALNP